MIRNHRPAAKGQAFQLLSYTEGFRSFPSSTPKPWTNKGGQCQSIERSSIEECKTKNTVICHGGGVHLYGRFLWREYFYTHIFYYCRMLSYLFNQRYKRDSSTLGALDRHDMLYRSGMKIIESEVFSSRWLSSLYFSSHGPLHDCLHKE